MKEIILSKESSEREIKEYFNIVLKLSQLDNNFPVNLDEVWPLVYNQKSDAVSALRGNFIEDIDYQVLRQNPQNLNGGRPTNEYHLSLPCMEFFIARKVRPVFDVYRKVFHHVAAAAVPQTFSQALYLAAEQAKTIEQQQQELRQQQLAISAMSSEIVEMKKRTDYLDIILSSKGTVTTTQIAQDYGMSARAFNRLIADRGIQHKVNGQWILYAPFMSKGYVHSRTIDIRHSDGTPDVRMTTEWTQRGRLFLYETLKKEDVLPVIERIAV